MALAIKISVGAAAICSVLMVASRDRDPVAATDPPIAFGDRFPLLIPPPSDPWRAQARVDPAPQPIADTAPKRAAAPQRTERHHRTACHRIHFTRNRHRYWRCRR